MKSFNSINEFTIHKNLLIGWNQKESSFEYYDIYVK
jgi:hypothetical protein